MSLKLLTLFMTVALLLRGSDAYSGFTMTIKPLDKACFYEILEVEERFDLSFQVVEGGNMDVDFWINTPDNQVFYPVYRQTTHTFGFNAPTKGKYTYCFSNQLSSSDSKVVTFTIQGPDDRTKADTKDSKNTDLIAPIQDEFRQLTNALRAIRDDQSFMAVREIRHQKTAESTSGRALYWALWQIIMVLGVGVWQIVYIRRFFEVKRIV